MILDPSTPRCQGRAVPIHGTASLAQECTSCVRRTDAPADVKSVPWMKPPVVPKFAFPPICPMHIAPAGVEEVA